MFIAAGEAEVWVTRKVEYADGRVEYFRDVDGVTTSITAAEYDEENG